MSEPTALRQPRTGAEGIQLSAIKEMELRASAIPGVVSLAQGIPSFGTPAVILRKAIAAIKEGRVAKYSLVHGLPQLREAIEQHLAASGIFYDFEEEILVTVGAIEAITATLLTILRPGDEVLLPNPCYASYPEAVRVAHGIPVWVGLEENRGWAFDIERLEAAVTDRTRAMIITNPNNPTGTNYTTENLRDVAELAVRHNLIILSDEVYKDIVFDQNPDGTSAACPTLAGQRQYRDRFVYIFSFSKSYAMTGWRVGFLATAKPLAREIRKVHDALVTCAPVVSQYAALAALEMAGSDIARYAKEYERRRNVVCMMTNELSAYFSYQRPVGAYYLFLKIRMPHENSKTFALSLLERARVAVVPGSAFGPEGEGHVRLCFARSLEDIEEGMRRIGKYVEEVRK